MYWKACCKCRAIVLLIKPIVFWRCRCRCRWRAPEEDDEDDEILKYFEIERVFLFQQEMAWLELSEVAYYFYHSLIIPKEKTMKIITLTVVWISDTNYHNILRTLPLNFSKNYCSFMKLYQKRYLLFHPISRHLEVGLQKLSRASYFNPLLGVWMLEHCVSFWIYYL